MFYTEDYSMCHYVGFSQNGSHIWYRVAVAIVYCGRSLHCDSVNECQLYAKGKNILRKSCIHENILPLNFLSMKKLFSVEKFLNYGKYCVDMCMDGTTRINNRNW